MDNTRVYGDHLPGVACSVSTCKYHAGDNCCHAEHIDVRNENAQKRAETFCGTFCCKDDGCTC